MDFDPMKDEKKAVMAEFEPLANDEEKKSLAVQNYIPPCMHCAVVICFDEEVSFDEIDTAIGIPATTTMQYNLTRMNPFTHKHNPGYWEYEMERTRSESCENLLDQIQNFLLHYGAGIRTVLNRYVTSELIIRIFLDIRQPNTFPDITIGKKVMEAILPLGGSIDIVVSEDFYAE